MSTIASTWVASQPWAIYPDALDGILALADRDMEGFQTAFARIPNRVGADTMPHAAPEMVSARGGDRIAGTWASSIRDGVAIVPVRGVISRYSTMVQEVCREGTSVKALAEDLRRCVDDPDVKAILLDVDSPGGEAAGISELASMIRTMAAKKPMCAYVGSLGASAGYWIASACPHVTMHSTAFVGSLGVVCSADTNVKKGVVTVTSSNAPMKRPDYNTDEGKASLQSEVDALESQFISAVAEFRDTTTAKVQTDFGRGGLKMGSDAVSAGMADDTGDFESTLAAMSSGAWQPARRTKAKVESKPGPTGKLNGASPKMFSFTKFFGLAAEKDPKLAAELVAEMNGDGTDVDVILKRLETGNPGMFTSYNTSVPVVDEEAIRAKVKAELETQANAKTSASIREFYSGQAKGYFTKLVASGSILPADVPKLTAAYVDAASNDYAGKLSLVDGTGKSVEFSRLDMLTSLIEAKPGKHRFTGEAIGAKSDGSPDLPADVTTLDPLSDDEAKVKAERKQKMLMATPEGRQALALKK